MLLLFSSASCSKIWNSHKPEENKIEKKEEHKPKRRVKRTPKPGRYGPTSGMSAVIEGTEYPGVPIVYHPEVNNFVRYYTKVKRMFVKEALPRRKKYLPVMQEIFKKYGLPIELINIAFVESRYIPTARSKDGYTTGMWQLSKVTARNYGLRVDGKVDERLDVRKSTEAAARFLAALYDNFGDWYLVMAAYNSGPTLVQKSIDAMDAEGPLETLDVFELTSRGFVCDITREFVAKIGALVIITKDLKKYDFEE
ncbi:MAG: lytic transglycosylase domain-containing protein [Proteobacteria bacterium]|nr:lytic transglycosylase domain-containing protein [Pseudomonadota bacterium]